MPGDRDPAMSQFRRLLRSPALGDPVVQCLLLIALTTIVFLAAPGIDLWFSRLFYVPDIGFAVSRVPAFIYFRDFHRNLTAIIVMVGIAILLIKVAWPQRESLLRPRDIAFILGTLAVGPGIVANLIFKNNWGRPRPFAVSEFGGEQPFVGIWRITDHCSSNCSFVSGEGSSAVWLLTLAVLLPPRWRPTAVRFLIGLGVALSLNRIAFGGHFLSDVLFAWWMTLIVMVLFYRLLYLSPPAALNDARLEDGLTRAGLGLRRAAAALKASVSGPRG